MIRYDFVEYAIQRHPLNQKSIQVGFDPYNRSDLEAEIRREYSFKKGRSIINCAEVWGAREHILAGGKFDELFIATRHFKPGSEFGTLYAPCQNCQHTFKDILSQLERTQ